MKKSTLIKVIALALTALFAFSLVACGGSKAPTVLITLDANGGTLPSNAEEEFEAEVGTTVGKLPTPTRGGYNFLGWFEDGNEDWGVDRKTKVEDYDMVFIALWEPQGELASVEFSVLDAGAELEAGAAPFVDIVKGQRISTAMSKLPTASRPDYIFKGWKDTNGNRVTVTTVVEGDLVLSPIWERVVYCLDGTENHGWNAWQEATEATCTDPAQNSRTCSICGHIEYNITQEALGHKFGTWATTITENGIVRSRVCVECDEKEADPLVNIAFDAFNTPVIDGDCWGGDKGANLFDNSYTDKPIAAKGTGALTVSTEAKEAVYVDIFAVTGFGSAAYNVTVYYDNGTQKTIGVGAFGSGESATKAFTIGATVTKFVVTMEAPSNGTDYWSEISILVVPS